MSLRDQVREALPPRLRDIIGKTRRFILRQPPLWIPESFPSMELSLKALHTAGFRPRTAVDIGAFSGEWTTFFRSIFPEARVLMVEPQESRREILTQLVNESHGMRELEPSLLSATDGQELIFHEMSTGSSVLAEQGQTPRTEIRKTSRSLDAVVASRPAFQPGIDFLKLDTQGYELEILKGAPHTLAHCQAVLMEASLIPINAGCPLIYEVMTFMHERDFRLVDFCSLSRRKDGTTWQTDLLFLRNDSPYLPIPRNNPENWFA